MTDVTRYVPAPDGKETVVFFSGDTNDIISVIQKIDRLCCNRRAMRKMAVLLRGENDLETCKNVWRWCVDNLEYKADKNHEKVKASNWLVYNKIGDCKSFSILIVDLLRELGYKCFFRFVAYDKTDSTPTHVFPICKAKNGELIVLDAVPFDQYGTRKFNVESDYTFYRDINSANLYTEGVGKIYHV